MGSEMCIRDSSVSVHVRLHKDRGLFRVESRSDELGRRAQCALAKFFWVLLHRDRVHVCDEEEGIVGVLLRDELLEGTNVVSEVEGPRGRLHT